MFYGLPIHIMRDLFMTTRSFVKRLTAFVRYRRATQDMNAKYEDATVEDIQREDTCIICREEMRPWSVTNPQAPPAAPGNLPPARPAATANERSRPKKLPCGHILHLGCLKSWLERQQVCPTCRRSVTDNGPQAGQTPANNANPAVPGAPPAAAGQQNGPPAPPPPAGQGAGRGLRMLNLGPIRVGFGQANLQDMANGFGVPQAGQENVGAGNARVYGLELGFPRRQQPQPQGQGANLPSPTSIQDHLHQIENQIVAEIRSLQITQQELQLVQLLQVELSRLRLMQNGGADSLPPMGAGAQIPPLPPHRQPRTVTPQPQMQRHGARPNTSAISAGSADLPPGVVIPEGWTLLPLQRLDGPASIPSVTQIGTVPASGPAAAPTATTSQTVTSPTSDTSNNTLTPTPTINPDNISHPSSVDSSDTNAIHTPPSIATDQSTAQDASTQNTTISSTTSTSAQASSDPSIFSNGKSSQLFSGSDGSMAHSRMGIPPWPVERTEGVNPEVSQVHPRTWSDTNNIDGATEQQREYRSVQKGKAKAVAVEDVDDEAEGS
jgi:E3 ubiquitin-protein ligase synoviolin